ncbi:MAG: energy-coupling factor transporter ATPase [Bacillota bacterium]|nr:energy-coupling factor transporter ATPase [Bacillota bacterium]
MEAIKVTDLTFSYDQEKDVIKNVSFSIPKGSYTTIVGHNGSGKSTIAKLLIGLLEAKSGKIEIMGKELSEDTVYDIRGNVGIVFQNPDNQFIGSTVADDIAFGLENHCVPQEKMEGIIHEVASQVHMTKYLNSEPTKLSGGQKQRVAIAGVLAIEPEIVIFDESTSMLDPQGKAVINKQIQKLHKNKNMTVLSITHDMEEVAQSEYVIVLKEGQIALEGSPKEVFSSGQLEGMKLHLPFAMSFSQKLVNEGILEDSSLTLEKVVEDLCRLKSKN